MWSYSWGSPRMVSIAEANKTETTRISSSTSSLEWLIGTFMVQDRDTQIQPVLGTHNNYYVAPITHAEFGTKDKTFRASKEVN